MCGNKNDIFIWLYSWLWSSVRPAFREVVLWSLVNWAILSSHWLRSLLVWSHLCWHSAVQKWLKLPSSCLHSALLLQAHVLAPWCTQSLSGEDSKEHCLQFIVGCRLCFLSMGQWPGYCLGGGAFPDVCARVERLFALSMDLLRKYFLSSDYS